MPSLRPERSAPWPELGQHVPAEPPHGAPKVTGAQVPGRRHGEPEPGAGEGPRWRQSRPAWGVVSAGVRARGMGGAR